MLGVQSYMPNTDNRDMMAMSGGPGPCMPMGAMPPNYPMPRGEGMYPGMMPGWAGGPPHNAPGGYGLHHPELPPHNMPDMGHHGVPANKYDPPPVSPPPQRERFSYTRYQLELLNGIYIAIRYPNSMQKQLLAKRVGITRDQVKIWFQNRRRKDVVGKNNPAKAPPPEDLSGKGRMVPEEVMQGVITELLKFENDPKGKKIKEAMERSKRSTQAHKRQKTVSSPESDSGRISNEGLDDLLESPKYQPQGAFPLPGEVPYGLHGNQGHGYPGGLNGSMEKSPLSYHDTSNSNTGSPQSSVPSPGEQESAHAPPQLARSVPIAEQLDMVAPPNAVVPHSMGQQGMKRRHSDISLPEEDEDIEEPPTAVRRTEGLADNSPPPNKVAPPSEPIKFSALSAFTPTKPMAVHIPSAMMRTSPNTAPPAQPESEYAQMAPAPPPTQWGVTDGGMVVRDGMGYGGEVDPQAFYMGPPPVTSHSEQHVNAESKSLNVNSVFPFPLVAEPPRIISSIASYPDHYAHAHTMAPGAYQPMMISSFNNPYYGYDASSWSGYQDKPQMTKN